jgi:hypothetical protein
MRNIHTLCRAIPRSQAYCSSEEQARSKFLVMVIVTEIEIAIAIAKSPAGYRCLAVLDGEGEKWRDKRTLGGGVST